MVDGAQPFAREVVWTGEGYENYDGAWGATGKAADRAYLNRTRFWVSRFKRERLGRAAIDERG